MSLIEAVGVLFGLLSVWYAVKENNWTWPLGMVNCVLFGILFYSNTWYVNVALQIIYIFYNLYSWYMWLHGGKNRTAPSISLTPAMAWGILLLAIGIGTVAVGWLYDGYTDDTVPYWDAVTVALSLVAQYMMTRKWLEHWWVWIVANAIYFGLGIFQQNYWLAGLQVVYIVLSVKGYLDWRHTLYAAVCDSLPAAVD